MTARRAGCARTRHLPRAPCSAQQTHRADRRHNGPGAARCRRTRWSARMPQSSAWLANKFQPFGQIRAARRARGAKWPLTKTSWHAAPGTRNGSSSRAVTADARSSARWNGVCAISARRLVKRQSSSCVVGNPASQKRAHASSRSCRSHTAAGAVLPQGDQFAIASR